MIHVEHVAGAPKSYDALSEAAFVVSLGELEVAFAGLSDLIRMKRAAGRAHDLADIEALTHDDASSQHRATMDLDVLFLGTAGSSPSPRRGLPATLVRRGGDRLLFDCGEGTQRQLMQSVGLVELEELFITHFHADHVLGLPGMLKTFALRQRERDLVVYGPRGLRRAVRAARRRSSGGSRSASS